MHELSLAENLREIIEEESSRQGFARVHTVRLSVGELSCVEPEALRFCFDEVMRGGLVEGALLEIETVKGEGHCRRCDLEVPMSELYQPCPQCHSPLEVIRGLEIRIEDLAVS